MVGQTGAPTMAVNISPAKSWEGGQTVSVVDRRISWDDQFILTEILSPGPTGIPPGKVSPGAVKPLIKNVEFLSKNVSAKIIGNLPGWID